MVEDGRFLSSQHIPCLIAKLMVREIGAIGVGGVRVVKGGGGDLALTFPGQCTLTCLTTFHDTKLIFLLLVLTGR